MRLKTSNWDAAKFLDDDEAVAIFMGEAFKTTLAVMKALGIQMTTEIPSAA